MGVIYLAILIISSICVSIFWCFIFIKISEIIFSSCLLKLKYVQGLYFFIYGSSGMPSKMSFISSIRQQRSATSIDSMEILNSDHITGCPNGCNNRVSNYEVLYIFNFSIFFPLLVKFGNLNIGENRDDKCFFIEKKIIIPQINIIFKLKSRDSEKVIYFEIHYIYIFFFC